MTEGPLPDPASAERPGRTASRLFAVLLLLWAALVWWLSSQSDPRSATGISLELPDWLVHGLVFAVGGFFARGAFQASKRVSPALAAVLVCAAWGVLDELHQAYVPDREPDGTDVAADLVGASVGAALHAMWAGGRGRRGVRRSMMEPGRGGEPSRPR